jgi:hypothetical protein
MSVKVEGSNTDLRFAAPRAPVLGLVSPSRPLAISRDGSRIYFLQSVEQPDAGVTNVRTRAIQ